MNDYVLRKFCKTSSAHVRERFGCWDSRNWLHKIHWCPIGVCVHCVGVCVHAVLRAYVCDSVSRKSINILESHYYFPMHFSLFNGLGWCIWIYDDGDDTDAECRMQMMMMVHSESEFQMRTREHGRTLSVCLFSCVSVWYRMMQFRFYSVGRAILGFFFCFVLFSVCLCRFAISNAFISVFVVEYVSFYFLRFLYGACGCSSVPTSLRSEWV